MSHELEFTKKTIVKAGKILSSDFKDKINIEYKGNKDIVTKTDLKSEKLIISSLKKEFPDHGIISEESEPARKKLNWIIDPLDGTANFSLGFPYFGISIALAEKDKVILGVIYNPLTKEIFWSEKGSFCNGKEIKVSKTNDINISVIDCTPKYINLLCNKEFSRRLGSSVIAFTDVASGRMDAKVKNNNGKPWDFAAGAHLVEESGGKVTDLEGKKWSLKSGTIIASNSLIHKDILECLKPKSI